MKLPAFRPYKVTAAYRTHRERNATWCDIGSWRVPDSFGDSAQETCRARQAAGLQDVSPIGKIDLKGAGIGGTLDVAKGVTTITAALKLRPDHALLLTEPGQESGACETLLSQTGTTGCAHLTDVTSALSAYFLVGPLAVDVLNRLTSLDVRRHQFSQHSYAQCSLAHVHATVYRDDWGELPAYLVLVSRDVGEYVWTAMETAGAGLGLTPFGRQAEQLLRKADPVASSVS